MSGLTIRLNEAQLLRAGMPKDAVVALREIIKIVGSGISAGGGLSDLEGLVLSAGREDAETANLRGEVERLRHQVGRSINLTGIESRLSQLEHRTAGL